ncbi:hypothetical protein BG011_005072 [Mortierella polycephala]|uniref:BZIP domain-containing protein n=1 Tax=Mortierella polycephala TaxID=41804 RepID=A0A9P6PWI1_9FUNG|nr:hypothetical protein BG011_005072 [Mortierella polycephala]
MSNPMFDDFIELDLLDPSEASSDDMFSYYLGDTTDLDSNTDLAAALGASSSVDDMNMALDLAIKQDSTTDSVSSQMLLDPSSSSTSPTISTADPTLTIVSADQLTFTPQQVTTISPSTISLSTVAPSSLSTESSIASPSKQSSSAVSTAAAVVATKNVQKSVASKALSSAATKRSSPEPVTPARKHAKTESVSKSKSSAASTRKSSTASSTSSSAAAAAASKTMSSSRSTASTASNSMTESPISTAALMSPINTTLSPATLQFLIQQQGETPLIPQLFTGKLSREEIEATLARLLESTKHLIAPPEEEPLAQIKEEPASDEESDDGMEGMEANEAIGMEQTHGLKTQPGIKTDDIPSSTDLKKMTSKERRQLRNKISARNFRVRRKEYIYTLEGQVLQHKTEARHLREAVTLVQEENQRLKDELELVRCQLAETTLATNGSVMAADCQEALQPTGCTGVTPLSKENQSLLTSIMNRNVSSALNPNAKSNLMLSMGRPQSPILTPNLHKDVPNSSSGSTGQSSWKDKNPIMVHTTLVPEICFGEEFQFGDKVAKSNEDDMVDRPWMRLQEQSKAQEIPKTFNPFWVSGVVFELMQTFVGMAMNMVAPETDGLVAVVATSSEELVVLDEIESEDEDEIDWELQQSLWAVTEQEDEGEMTEEQIQLLYGLSQLQLSDIRPSSPTLVSQEDPNMLEWLYESMMARLVDLDLQSTQDHSYGPMTDSRSA